MRRSALAGKYVENITQRFGTIGTSQVTQDRNFDARNDRTASGAPVRRKGDDRSQKRRQKTCGF